MRYHFEWHEEKNRLNRLKHGVDFHEAVLAFQDDDGLLIRDSGRQAEERFILIGLCEVRGYLVVVHCYRQDDAVVRIISARRANKKEIRVYQDRLT